MYNIILYFLFSCVIKKSIKKNYNVSLVTHVVVLLEEKNTQNQKWKW
jgi:hypothetical protein